MPKVSDYPQAGTITKNDSTYLIQDETDKCVSMGQLKDYILDGRKLTDVEIRRLSQNAGKVIIVDPKW